MFEREEFRPIIDGITIGLQVLLVFIGALTLGIGGMGAQSLAEALVLALAVAVGSLPLLRPAFKDTSGKGDIHPANSLATVAVSTGILVLVGALSGAIVSEWTIHSRCATSGVRQRRQVRPLNGFAADAVLNLSHFRTIPSDGYSLHTVTTD